MNNQKEEIRAVEDKWKSIFSKEIEFSKHLHRWQNEALPDMHDQNQFVVSGKVTEEEIEQAYTYQKERGDCFLKLDARTRLDRKLVDRFEFEEGITYVMVLPDKKRADWKRNKDVVLRDVKTGNIAADLESIELANYGAVYGEDFTKRKIRHFIEKAKEVEGFHYYGAYLDGRIAGACYVYEQDGYLQLDGLIVNEQMRHKGVATTILKFMEEHYGQTLFLHAYADDTPRKMYAAMGFEKIDTLYEYTRKIQN